MKENDFQSDLIKEIKRRFPGAFVLKTDPTYIQGVPDLLVLYEDRWAMLECKRSESSPVRPNQPYWVNTLNRMSFAAFIYPENAEEVLHELQHTFRA